MPMPIHFGKLNYIKIISCGVSKIKKSQNLVGVVGLKITKKVKMLKIKKITHLALFTGI